MADFYGILQGNRGIASRLGSKHSGIQATLKSYNHQVEIRLKSVDGVDKLEISIPETLNTFINGRKIKRTELIFEQN